MKSVGVIFTMGAVAGGSIAATFGSVSERIKGITKDIRTLLSG
jgi:hypothetical protein